MRVDLQASRNYADALFAAAKEADAVADLLEQAVQLHGALEATPEAVAFLEAPHIPTEDKLALAERVLGDRFLRLLRNFVLMLVKRNRVEVLREALKRVKVLAERDQGISQATVTSAAALAEADRNRLHAALEGFTRHKLRVEYKINPDLIGGIVFQWGDTLVDNSLRGNLTRLGERWMAARVN
ncbi:ATP synthase F1 subunit delta [Candidatus Poribacteria bacterium]|nr:ATP synthase F1 subunit delta [Candidatus Poribacteria bacterium]